jgi:hypothetical protein
MIKGNERQNKTSQVIPINSSLNQIMFSHKMATLLRRFSNIRVHALYHLDGHSRMSIVARFTVTENLLPFDIYVAGA